MAEFFESQSLNVETVEQGAGDSDRYPEYPLSGRYAKAWQWLENEPNQESKKNKFEALLDAGCAWGYGTRFFREKSKKVCGLDPDRHYIALARSRYPDMEFVHSRLEQTPFTDNAFDVIIACDTLEHVDDEVRCLSEIFRLLQPEGILILTTPHKGLFGFMDPENAIPYVEYFFKRYCSGLFQMAYWLRKGKLPDREKIAWEKPRRDRLHRHYTQKELLDLLDRSEAKGKYRLMATFRSGLFLGVFLHNLEFYTALFFRGTAMEKFLNPILIKPLRRLAEIDYWLPYHIFAYNIALKIVKTL